MFSGLFFFHPFFLPASELQVCQSQALTPVTDDYCTGSTGHCTALQAPGDHVLEQVGQEFPDTAAQLEAIERRAIEAAGPRQNPTKRKIINSLRRKGL